MRCGISIKCAQWFSHFSTLTTTTTTSAVCHFRNVFVFICMNWRKLKAPPLWSKFGLEGEIEIFERFCIEYDRARSPTVRCGNLMRFLCPLPPPNSPVLLFSVFVIVVIVFGPLYLLFNIDPCRPGRFVIALAIWPSIVNSFRKSK